MDSSETQVKFDPVGKSYCYTNQHKCGDEIKTERLNLRILLDGTFSYTHTVSTYDPFDGDTHSNDTHVNGHWTNQDQVIQLVGNQTKNTVDYKHCLDEDGTQVLTNDSFQINFTYDQLQKLEFQDI